jgi:hypothetical protein
MDGGDRNIWDLNRTIDIRDLVYCGGCLWRTGWAGNVAHMGERRGVYRILVKKPEGKTPLGRPSRRWEDNIKTDLQEVGWGSMDWIELA